MEENNFNLKCENHSIFFKSELKKFTEKPIFSDVTLACRGSLFPTHRLVLACCSPYFKHILQETPGDNTIIVINDLHPEVVSLLIAFMYCGEVDVKKENLAKFFQAAKYLDIKSLSKGILGLESDKDIVEELLQEKDNLKAPVSKEDTSTAIQANQSNGSDQHSSTLKIVPNMYQFDKANLPNTTWSQSQIKTEHTANEPLLQKAVPTLPKVNGFSTNGRQVSTIQTLDDIQDGKNYMKRKYGSLEDIKEEASTAEYSPESSTYDSQFENESMDGNPLPYTNVLWEKAGNSSIASASSDSVCSNCNTNNTKLWRRSSIGDMVCNACGLYFKLHGYNRPSHLFRNTPMTRRRNPRKKKYDDVSEMEHQDTIMSNGEQEHLLEVENNLARDQDVLNAAMTLNNLFMKSREQKTYPIAPNQTNPPLWISGGVMKNIPQPPVEARVPQPLLKFSGLHNGSGPQERKIYSVSRLDLDRRSHAEAPTKENGTGNSNFPRD